MKFYLSSILLLIAFSLLGCEQEIAPLSLDVRGSGCTSNEAQIRVSDGYFEILCGCNEPGGTPVTTPGNLTCTVSANKTVFFLYLDTHSQHQIISTGGIPFVPSAPNDPTNASSTQVFAVQTPTVGTSSFADAFNSHMTGQLVITP